MSTVSNVLANSYAITGSSDFPLAEINGESARETVYELLVESVTGAPSTASLAARLQQWMSIGGGDEYEWGGRWVDLLSPRHRYFFLTAAGGSDQSAHIRYLNSFQIGDYATGGTGYATILLRDGSTSGDTLHQVNLPAAGSVQYNWAEPLHFPNGLYVHATGLGTGITVRGSAFGDFDHNVPALLPGGSFPSVLATHSLASPRLVTRRVVGGLRTRIVLTPTFSGGSSPSFVVSAHARTIY